jgi:hypothetical protein
MALGNVSGVGYGGWGWGFGCLGFLVLLGCYPVEVDFLSLSKASKSFLKYSLYS